VTERTAHVARQKRDREIIRGGGKRKKKFGGLVSPERGKGGGTRGKAKREREREIVTEQQRGERVCERERVWGG
jgi:hypothetical protein